MGSFKAFSIADARNALASSVEFPRHNGIFGKWFSFISPTNNEVDDLSATRHGKSTVIENFNGVRTSAALGVTGISSNGSMLLCVMRILRYVIGGIKISTCITDLVYSCSTVTFSTCRKIGMMRSAFTRASGSLSEHADSAGRQLTLTPSEDDVFEDPSTLQPEQIADIGNMAATREASAMNSKNSTSSCDKTNISSLSISK